MPRKGPNPHQPISGKGLCKDRFFSMCQENIWRTFKWKTHKAYTCFRAKVAGRPAMYVREHIFHFNLSSSLKMFIWWQFSAYLWWLLRWMCAPRLAYEAHHSKVGQCLNRESQGAPKLCQLWILLWLLSLLMYFLVWIMTKYWPDCFQPLS